ncbi:lysophospholipase [Bradyrhizobium sediminis]|uniref:Lysophospholipase n=1 Tax=Bradyrhizobium sediminis TaxID=2840469 RepID=A0A975NIP2_9BRAD|nr:alpha/beta fold hydrolase [Bradyrhizobium sediminis]QWG15246.1 lysophospholipase [Bradyrhizobium sediminis]
MRLEIISKYPSGGAHSTPLLFVHGAWHGAWCWDVHFLDYFVQQGFAAHAVSLRGHGKSEGRERLRWTSIASYVQDVEAAAQQLPNPPVLIGHSMGGFVVQKYLEKHPSPAGILLASVPPRGVLATTLRIARRHPLILAKMNLTLSLFPLVATPQLAREAFFSERMADEEVLRYWRNLQEESYRGFMDMLALALPNPRKVATPLLVLGGAQDTVFHPSEVEATARAYHTEAEIFSDMAHDMMLEPRWQAVAERMLGWLTNRNLAGA